MKFSEALREADARGLPDRCAAFIARDTREWMGEKPPCCAIGGAAVVSGSFQFEVDPESGYLMEHSRLSAQTADRCDDWKDIVHGTSWCPMCRYKDPTYNMVMHLYDAHLWSRTQIADWLDEVMAS